MSEFGLVPQALADGILLGAVYALIAVGLTMVFGVMRIVNFAHGDYLMVGLYLTYLTATTWGLEPYAATIIVLPAIVILAALTYVFLIEPIVGKPDHYAVLVTIGISLVLQNVALALFSADLHTIPSRFGSSTLHVLGVFERWPAIVAFVASVVLCLGLYWLLRSTDLGRKIRATAQDRDAALLCGVPVRRIYLISFCIGIGSLGLVAPLLAPFYYVAPTVGATFTLTAFVIVVLGSMGNFLGALCGGFIIGIVEALGGLVTEGSMPKILTYGAFVLLLLFRPTGLFGRSAAGARR